ncbi:MAG TPA: inositol monophosphatase family protein [Polyangiaceae bacterium]|nr:inositol monophosphatase family protein [Polyangiaceae bacterium]
MSRSVTDILLDISARASKVVLEVYGTAFDVEYKGPSDPVTIADKRANELICTELAREFPGVPIVAEESPPATFADFRSSERVFFVDPVDGTREFVARNGEFVVMIGLLDGDRPVAGVIQAPVQGVTWVGVVGEGAYAQDASGVRTPIRVSSEPTLAAARIVSSRSHRDSELERVLSALGAAQIIIRGSAGLKGAEVARGAAEAYVAPGYAGQRWDACASEALVVAAGGRVTDTRGRLLDYRALSLTNDCGVVASNGAVHDAVLEQLARLPPEG